LIASALSVKLKQLDKMHNLDCGLWQGMQIDEVRRRQPKAFKQWQEHPELLSPPEGETPAEAEQRIAASLDKLCKKHKQGTVAIVVPEPLASIVRSHLLDTELSEFWADSSACGTWEILAVPDLAGVN
jgi:broad specificity phosphatase PhoE